MRNRVSLVWNNVLNVLFSQLFVLLIALFFLVYLFMYLVYFFLYPLLLVTISSKNVLLLNVHYLYSNMWVTQSTNSNYLSIFEINLPFFSTDIFYLYIIGIFVILLLVPYLIFLFIWYKGAYYFKFELERVHFLLLSNFFLYHIMNYLIYTLLLPYILDWMFKHYSNFIMFELDVLFDVSTYIFLYVKILLCNFICLLVLSVFPKEIFRYFIVFLVVLLSILSIHDLVINIVMFIVFYVLYVFIGKSVIIIVHLKLIQFYNSVIQGKGNV